MFVFVAIASVSAVIVNDQGWLDIDPSGLGLALSMLIQLSGLFQYGIRQVSAHNLVPLSLGTISASCRDSS